MKSFTRRVRDLDRALFRMLFGLKWAPLTAVMRAFTVVGTAGALWGFLAAMAFLFTGLEPLRLLIPWAAVAASWTVAEWPEGKELEDGVFVSGAISASHIKGRARSNRYLAPSAIVHEAATAAQGIKRRRGWRPVSKKARAARKPQRAPAVPTTVKARITAVSGAHFRLKSTRNSARSRSLTLRVEPFKFLPQSSINRWLL